MGRPRKIPTEAEVNAPFDFGKTNQKFNDVERFCRFWAEYPDKDALKGYLYRLSPVIDRRQTNVKLSNIDTFDAPTDTGEVLRRWGSGKYEFRLSDPKRGEFNTQVARCVFELEDSDLPASFNPSDLVVVGENRAKNEALIQRYMSQGWVIVEGQKNSAYVDKNTKEPIPFASLLPPSAAGNASPAERELAETVRTLATDKQAAEVAALGSRDAILSQLLGVILKNQSADPMEKAFQIAERLTPKAPAIDPVQVELLKVIAGLVKDSSTPPAPAAASNPLETTRQTIGMLKEMGWAGPGESSGGGGGFWTAVFASLPSVLEMLRPALAALALRPAPAVAGAPGFMAPAGMYPAAPPAAGPLPGVVVPAEAGESEDEVLGFNSLMELAQDALDAFQRGITGFDFAHGMICRRGGEMKYAVLFKMGKQTLMGALDMAQNAPQLNAEQRAMLQAKRGEVEAFVDSFLSYADTSKG